MQYTALGYNVPQNGTVELTRWATDVLMNKYLLPCSLQMQAINIAGDAFARGVSP